MPISEKVIREFKEIYYKQYGEILSDEEVEEKGQRVLTFFRIVYRPIPEDEENKLTDSDVNKI